jgi:hypothetical protein
MEAEKNRAEEQKIGKNLKENSTAIMEPIMSKYVSNFDRKAVFAKKIQILEKVSISVGDNGSPCTPNLIFASFEGIKVQKPELKIIQPPKQKFILPPKP